MMTIMVEVVDMAVVVVMVAVSMDVAIKVFPVNSETPRLSVNNGLELDKAGAMKVRMTMVVMLTVMIVVIMTIMMVRGRTIVINRSTNGCPIHDNKTLITNK